MSNYQPLSAEQYDLDSLSTETELVGRIPNDATAHADYHHSSQHRRSSSFASSNGHSAKISFDASIDILERKRIWWRNAIINCCFIGTWFVFATALSLYNKWMFSPAKFGFPSPLFVTMVHMFVQFSLAASMRAIWPSQFRPARSPGLQDYGKNAVPCAVTTGLDIGLSNLSLKTITLSFYTMCKSSSLIFVLLFAFLFRLETFSWRLISVIFLIFVGVVLMVATETQFALGGMLLVLTASACGGLRWALTQVLLVGKRGREMGMDSPAAGIYWLAPTMGLTLAILSIIIEGWGALFASKFFESFGATLRTLVYVISPGVLAFIMVMSEFYIIQRVGIVPMSVAGIFKEVTTITLSAWVFGDEITPVNIVGVSITFMGIALFTHHKYQKSVHSTVPLDAHGNPLGSDEEEGEIAEATELFDESNEAERPLVASSHDPDDSGGR